jgi:hypothetical protein
VDQGTEKLLQLRNADRVDGLIPLNDGNFGRLVLSKERPYHMFVLFSSHRNYHSCDACRYGCCCVCWRRANGAHRLRR